MARPLLYGWFDPNKQTFLVSKYPPDAPVRPSIPFETMAAANEFIRRKRLKILWFPPLPPSAPRPTL